MKTIAFILALTITTIPCSFAQYHNDEPVKTIYLETEDDLSQLVWQTETESNTSYFLIEVSNNGIAFESYTTVDAQGHSLKQSHYSIEIPIELADKHFRITTMYMGGAMATSQTVCTQFDTDLVTRD